MTSEYHHQPLPSQRSIRLFTISASRDRKAAIIGSLSEVNLDSNPSFEALSYVWGSPDPAVAVTIVTQPAGSTKTRSILQVTPNCLTALQSLRYRFRPRRLWIDAICIDQTSIAEKNQQVPLMAEIYGRAGQVLVWLNPGNQDENRICETGRLFRWVGWLHSMRLLRLYETDEQAHSRMPKATSLVTMCDRWMDSKCQKLGVASAQMRPDSFNAPFLNTYFQRVWTVQEIAMSQRTRVHYGARNVSWADFVASGLFAVKRGGFVRNQEAQIDVFRDSEIHWNLLNALESHFVLPDIYGLEALFDRCKTGSILNKFTPGVSELALIKSRGLNAKDAKDKAYAMLWAFPEPSQATDALRRIDYEKPIDIIFTEYTTAIFVKMRGDPMQFYMVNSVPRNPNLPSWVPDWKEHTSMSYFIWTHKLMDFRAAKEDSGRYQLAINGRILSIRGIEHSKMKALVRLNSSVRQRNLVEASPEELVEGLIDTIEVIRTVIQVGRTIVGSENEGLLESIHGVIHSQVYLHSPGPEDRAVFLGKPKEVELSTRLHISVGLLRLQVFDKLNFLMDENTIPQDSIRTALEQFLLQSEIDETINRAERLSNLPAFLAVLAALSPHIDLYRFVYIAMLDHRDKDFFITDQGNVGVAFQGVRDTDAVALWKGCPSPVIVREEGDGRGMYRLHGPAYVDGIMNGEAWLEQEEHWRLFEII